MRRCRPLAVTALAISLALSGSLNPAFAGGLIPTERMLAAPAQTVESSPQLQRQQLHSALIAAGVDGAFAGPRLEVLSDAEVARLARDLHEAPAGGVWFLPFLVVAAVIGVLIGSRHSTDSPRLMPATDLFGRPLNVAGAP